MGQLVLVLVAAESAIAFYGHRTLHGVLPTTFEGMRVITSANYRWRK